MLHEGLSRLGPVFLVLLTVPGCTSDADAASWSTSMVAAVDGLLGPESVKYDADADVYYISNIRGYGSIKDNNGYIVRAAAENLSGMTIIVQGGRNGAVLHAPKGMALSGDTLWVADIDAVRGFHRLTGVPVVDIDLAPHGAMLLNDIALGADGALYATDTGILMSDMGVIYQDSGLVYRIAADRTVSVLAQGPELQHPNGITWDGARNRWLIVSFAPFHSQLYALPARGGAKTVLMEGSGRFDGVETLRDGRIIYSAWNDSSLHLLDGDRHRRMRLNLWQPADIGVDTRRGRVAIPLVLPGRVELWDIPDADSTPR